MKARLAEKRLRQFVESIGAVLSRHQLHKIFDLEHPEAFAATLKRLVAAGTLQSVTRGIYHVPDVVPWTGYELERTAALLRYGEFNYVSLESALSQCGAISQQMVDYVTVMTTGRSGLFKTFFGCIEFTHTKRPLSALFEATVVVSGRPLRVARPLAALRDLKRVGRNVNMVDLEDLDDIVCMKTGHYR